MESIKWAKISPTFAEFANFSTFIKSLTDKKISFALVRYMFLFAIFASWSLYQNWLFFLFSKICLFSCIFFKNIYITDFWWIFTSYIETAGEISLTSLHCKAKEWNYIWSCKNLKITYKNRNILLNHSTMTLNSLNGVKWISLVSMILNMFINFIVPWSYFLLCIIFP